jgi:hypothetical protein
LCWGQYKAIQFGVVTNLIGKMVTLNGHWHAGQVCSSQINPGFKCTGQDGIVWRCVGEQFADIIMVNKVPYGGGGVMVWAGIRYGQQKQQHFIDGNLNAQTYRDEILWPIVVPFIRHHHLMFQHDNAPCQKDLYTIPGS